MPAISSMEARVRDTLARHREDPPAGIPSVLPIHHQMDRQFCEVVTKDLAKYCTHWETRLATPTLWQQLPAECGVYMFVFASSLSIQLTSEAFSPAWVLYVGRAGSANSTRTIKDRYKGEYCKFVGGDPEVLWKGAAPNRREDRLAYFLAIYPLKFWYATVADRDQIPMIEDRLIKLLAPTINQKQMPSLRRYGTEQNAF